MLFFRVSKHRWRWKIALVDSGLEMRGTAWASGVQKFNLDGNSAILEKLVRDGELHRMDAKKDSAPNCVSNSTAPKLEKAQSGAQEEALSMERPAPILKKWFSTEVKNSPEEITEWFLKEQMRKASTLGDISHPSHCLFFLIFSLFLRGYAEGSNTYIAITAAAVMAGALGGVQAGTQSNQNGLHSQSALANDPLTLRLAKMSRSQLNEIMSELKVMATQNKELARQLLLARPQLPKALFQAQIMLGMVTPQVLQMPNIRQASGHPTQLPLRDSQQAQPPAVQTLPGLPPLAQNKMQSGLMPKVQESQASTVSQNPSVHNQFSSPLQPRIQLPQHANNHIVQQATVLGQSTVSTLPPVLPISLSSLSSRPQIQGANSSSLNHQVQPHMLQRSGQVGAANLGHSFQMANPNARTQSSVLPHPPLSDAGFQAGPSVSSGIPQAINKDNDKSTQVPDSGTRAHKSSAYINTLSGSMVHDSLESINRPPKLMKLDDGRGSSFSAGSLNVSNTTGSGLSKVFGVSSLPVNLVPKAEAQYSEKQISQLPAEVESVLLQQVLNLTPEQVSSLPPEQQQQVIQLQQALRRDQIQPS